MKRNLINLLGIILMGIGTFLFLSPDFSAYRQQKKCRSGDQSLSKGKEDSEGKRSFLSGGLTV